ncbi:MAG TPA: ATP-dependent DNA ligase [Candidatus Sulfotelmatobacter sp.]|jgi:DNA ligase-1|nr:ATP-dependent DNA ligase [Candidatus Sulfotelmatobacter sp.]
MKFAILATYFEKLEGTPSRLELIQILSNLFKTSNNPQEISEICYLVQGRIAPFYESIEIGMADRMVSQSIAQAYDINKEKVWQQYQQVGDMGMVALHLNSKRKKQNSKLSVKDVFTRLNEIAHTSGEGSVEKKITALANLLQAIDEFSSKFLVRIPLGKLRLGIGDPTILDALITAKVGEKTQRKVLEGAYNRTSDLGYIAKNFWTGGLESVKELPVTVGRPIRSELCERLPSPTKVIEKMGEVDAQFKYDGFRVQIHKDGNNIRIFSRNLEETTKMFPELIEATRRQIKATTAILDGEAIAYNPASEEFLSFQETTKRRRKHNIEETAKELPLKAFIFDILYKNNKSLLDEPLTTRLKLMKETIETNDVLIPAKTQNISDPKKLMFLLEEAISNGLEGLVVKKLNSPYEAGGRNFNWVKLKRHSNGELNDTIDCVILGYIYGKGKRAAFGAGALLVGLYDAKRDVFVTVTRIGTGLSDDEWRSIKEKAKGLEVDHKPARVESFITPSVWVKPELVIEVLADEITRSPLHTAGAIFNNGVKEPGYALRFPRLVSFREKDKKAEDATTVDELIEMYQDQGRK